MHMCFCGNKYLFAVHLFAFPFSGCTHEPWDWCSVILKQHFMKISTEHLGQLLKKKKNIKDSVSRPESGENVVLYIIECWTSLAWFGFTSSSKVITMWAVQLLMYSHGLHDRGHSFISLLHVSFLAEWFLSLSLVFSFYFPLSLPLWSALCCRKLSEPAAVWMLMNVCTYNLWLISLAISPLK